MYAIQRGQLDPVGAHNRLRSTPGQIQLSTEMIEVGAEDEEVEVACEVEVLDVGMIVEDEELVLDGVLELTLDEEEDAAVLDEGVELTELVELEEEAVLEVVDLLGRVAMYPAATTPTIRITRITIVCTRVIAARDPSMTIFPRSPSHII